MAYIEREALIDEINIAPVSMSICMNVDECKGRIYERDRQVRIINEASAADVVARDCYDRLLIENDELRKERPVRHGRWARIDYEPYGHDYICSVCGWKNDMASYYCPSCGARMDLGTDCTPDKDGD